ncbi:Type I restriction-modification system methyltransferase subunit [Streptomyces sp. LaPpAH-199]|uniref:N-6 DNA methylase n=1 Tax=Streptomyces TaxID=1883 RepID=UPI000891B774|nr:N-6 DNA methylase [Streptomyces sp. LaPpAH-199]MYW79340.1 N-6 DNA methylase [Streptomyces sp. SID8369]SDD36261.1 Type I restriction-modification system methyltransferase subunit [Streptomyces sp. LaPpAH-199]
MTENATEVTAAGIARLAGVGRAAVSNWRRRHADFPLPVGGTGTSPSFALAEVEQWLRDQGKLVEVPLRERVWQAIAGHPAGAVQALIHTGCALLLVRDRPTAWLELAAAPDERMAALLPHAMEHVLADRFGPEADTGVHTVPSPETSGVHTALPSEVPGVHTVLSPGAPGVHTPSRAESPAAESPAAESPAAESPAAESPAVRAAGTPDGRRPQAARAVHTPTARDLMPSVPLLRAAAELAAGIGAGQAFAFLLGRQLDANPRQYTLTPAHLAELMADLAEPPPTADRTARGQHVRTVLDPAAGTGALLRAVHGPAALYGQEADPALAALTALRLALDADTPRGAAPGPDLRTGDTLRADAFPELAADTVLCHPPFNERNWGHEELAYDPRWEYGLPARTESELAWVQHVLARLRDGGTAVLLMPPAAASRRSGRRVRAGLLRRGALQAVIALPAGAAPPYGIPLHLWVLRRPEPGVRPAADVLLADTTGLPGPTTAAPEAAPTGGRERLDWPAVRAAVLDAWRERADVEGVSRVVPVVELLDDDVDLAPARHLPRPAPGGGASGLGEIREKLAETLRLTAELVPPAAVPAGSAHLPLTTVGELARAGALRLRTGTAAPGSAPVPVLTEHDVLTGAAPAAPAAPPAAEATGTDADETVLLEPGDVVVPVVGGGSAARVVDGTTAGAALGRNLQLLRPDPAALDPWFLAGFLRGTANHRQASSHASTAARLDARRLHLPRMPLADQRRYGERFRELAAFEDALRTAGRLGGLLVQGMYDGLADGTVTP